MGCSHTLLLQESPLAVDVNTQKGHLRVIFALLWVICIAFGIIFVALMDSQVQAPLGTEAVLLGKGYPDNLGMQRSHCA